MNTIEKDIAKLLNEDRPDYRLDKAAEHRKKYSISRTMAKLITVNKCKDADAYRILRNKRKKEGYIGPKRIKKPIRNNG